MKPTIKGQAMQQNRNGLQEMCPLENHVCHLV